MKNIIINLVYIDETQHWRFEDLAMDRGVISAEYLNEDDFFFLPGGIEFICDNHFIFFQSYDYHDVFECVSFLLNTLKILGEYNGIVTDRALPSNKTVLTNTGKDVLSFNADTKETISLSYSYKAESDSRNNFSFCNISIEKESWINSSVIALNEYFKVTEIVLEKFGGIDKKSVLNTFLTDWKSFSSNSKPI